MSLCMMESASQSSVLQTTGMTGPMFFLRTSLRLLLCVPSPCCCVTGWQPQRAAACALVPCSDSMGNKAAFITLDKRHEPELTQFEASVRLRAHGERKRESVCVFVCMCVCVCVCEYERGQGGRSKRVQSPWFHPLTTISF